MYKACIFDLDGTLTNTLESLTYSVNQTLIELGLREITKEQCRMFIGDGARCLMERALAAAGDTELVLAEQAMEVYGRIFQKNCTYQVTLYEGMAEMVQALREEGIQLNVLSNKPHAQAVKVVDTFFEAGTFAHVQGQIEGVPRKPNPKAVFMIAEKLHISKEECLYIGDSDVDMKTGNAAGVDTVGVSWGFRSREVLKEHGATYIIDKPEELVNIIKKVK